MSHINVYECPECRWRIEVKHDDAMLPTIHCKQCSHKMTCVD